MFALFHLAKNTSDSEHTAAAETQTSTMSSRCGFAVSGIFFFSGKFVKRMGYVWNTDVGSALGECDDRPAFGKHHHIETA